MWESIITTSDLTKSVFSMTKALVLLAQGCEEIEAVTIVDILRRCGIKVTVAGLTSDIVEGSHGLRMLPDRSVEGLSIDSFDAIVCPGGAPGYENYT